MQTEKFLTTGPCADHHECVECSKSGPHTLYPADDGGRFAFCNACLFEIASGIHETADLARDREREHSGTRGWDTYNGTIGANLEAINDEFSKAFSMAVGGMIREIEPERR